MTKIFWYHLFQNSVRSLAFAETEWNFRSCGNCKGSDC